MQAGLELPHPREHITHLGHDSQTWTVANVVKWIDNGEHTFYTFEAGKRADIYVRQGTSKTYVQTKADGVWQTNLLSLPSCTVAAA